MHPARFILLLLLGLSLAGCARKGSWLKGKWVLDRELTRQKVEEQAASTSSETEGIGGAVRDLASSVAAPMMLSMLENVEITFTEDEIFTTIDGAGKAIGYEVIEAADRDTVTIKKADGAIQTFKREGRHAVTAGPAPISMLLYLKRAE